MINIKLLSNENVFLDLQARSRDSDDPKQKIEENSDVKGLVIVKNLF